MASAGKTILVTGGAGYIGSHTCIALLEEGYDVVVVDNLCNSSVESLQRVRDICGVDDKRLAFIEVDISDKEGLEKVFQSRTFDACIHFAGLKAVGESVAKPLMYYSNNLTGTCVLLEVMHKYGCRKIVFSSSATVYSGSDVVPMHEGLPRGATNPYGRTKLFIEDILMDLQKAEPDWKIMLLRYFNPVGAHPSGRIGEDPKGIPNNLMPFVQQVAVGRLKELRVFGSDYPTPDGTGVRDYIHVCDLAEGHVAALRHVNREPHGFCDAVNLGTGKGVSVLEIVHEFERASGKEIPKQIVARRPGDIATVYADTQKATKVLGWAAKRSLADMCKDQWMWCSTNPYGYAKGP